jgi:RNA polymerase sigma factor (TIGR02999 family)
MKPSPSPEVTALLRAWRLGDEGALDQLAPIVYDELRRIARRQLRGERPDRSLQATALVHEAYLKLVDIREVDWQDRAHFFAMSARVMRRILVDAARARHYQKRGGGAARVTLEDVQLPVAMRDRDLLALDDALEALARADERKSRVVELRFFGGLSLEETAAALQVSSDTVTRDWKFAKTWLLRELRRD